MKSEEAAHILLLTQAVGLTLHEPEDIRYSPRVISLPLTKVGSMYHNTILYRWHAM
jgi:hypothetical protein